MPRINICKVDRPLCVHCGKSINADTYCEITTATNRKINMHRECVVDFAVSILVEASKDKDLSNLVQEAVGTHVKHIPHSHTGISDSGEYEYYDCWNLVSPNGCRTCSDYDRDECRNPHCSLRDE